MPDDRPDLVVASFVIRQARPPYLVYSVCPSLLSIPLAKFKCCARDAHQIKTAIAAEGSTTIDLRQIKSQPVSKPVIAPGTAPESPPPEENRTELASHSRIPTCCPTFLMDDCDGIRHVSSENLEAAIFDVLDFTVTFLDSIASVVLNHRIPPCRPSQSPRVHFDLQIQLLAMSP